MASKVTEQGKPICSLIYYTEEEAEVVEGPPAFKKRGRKPKFSGSKFQGLPLKATSMIVEIHHTLAELKLRQFYSAGSDWMESNDVFFTISRNLEGFTLFHFQAKVYKFTEGSGRKVTSVVQASVRSLEEAHAEYSRCLKKGSTIDRREINENSSTFKMRIGPVEPNEFVEVTMHFVTELVAIKNSVGSYNLTVPSYLSFGRFPQPQPRRKVRSTPFTGQIVVTSGSKILNVHSPTHDKVLKLKSSLQTGDKSGQLVIAEFSDYDFNNEDFELGIKIETPSELVLFTEEAIVAGIKRVGVMAHLIPVQDTPEVNSPEIVIAISTGGGSNNHQLMEFTLMTLISLMPNSFINIISDVNGFESFSTTSSKPSAEMKFFVSTLIKKLSEMLPAETRSGEVVSLKDVLRQSFSTTLPVMNAGAPRRVILVHNVENDNFNAHEKGKAVLMAQSRPMDSMIFTMSVGKYASTTMERISILGGGDHSHIPSSDDESKLKIRNMVVKAFKCDIKGVKIEWEDNVGQKLSRIAGFLQFPSEIITVANGEGITLFASFNKSDEDNFPKLLNILIKSPGKYRTQYKAEVLKGTKIATTKPGIIHRQLAARMLQKYPAEARLLAIELDTLLDGTALVATDPYHLPQYSRWVLPKNDEKTLPYFAAGDTFLSDVLARKMENMRLDASFEMLEICDGDKDEVNGRNENACSSQSSEMDVESSLDASVLDYFDKLKQLQSYDGSFLSTVGLAKWIGISFKHLMKRNNGNPTIWSTSVILSLLAEKYIHLEILWESIACKAEAFLRSKLREDSSAEHSPFSTNSSINAARRTSQEFVKLLSNRSEMEWEYGNNETLYSNSNPYSPILLT